MKIDRNNYELYFIDYFEGKLNRQDEEALLDFLAGHPDIKSEFNEFEKHYSEVNKDGFKFKGNLKKQVSDLGTVNEDTIDEYSIAYLENDLNEDEKATLLEAVQQHTAFERTFRLYQLTKLKPDWRLIYKYKKQLKHFVPGQKTVLRTLGYAAAAAVLIAGFILINPLDEGQPEQQQVTNVDEKSEKTSTEIANVPETKPVRSVQKIDKSRNNSNAKAKQETGAQQPENSNAKKKIMIAEMEKLETRSVHALDNSWQAGIVITQSVPQNNETAVNKPAPSTGVQITENKVKSQNRGIDLLAIAQIGVKIFSKLNERNIELEPAYNNGQLQSVTVITEQRKITAPAI